VFSTTVLKENMNKCTPGTDKYRHIDSQQQVCGMYRITVLGSSSSVGHLMANYGSAQLE